MNDDNEARLFRLEASATEVKATLARLEPMLIKVLETQAEMRGEMHGQFHQIGQRISDLNARLPVSIGVYQPQDRRTG
ncbi:MAG: hypothetical protein H7840_09905 [Alphaproteobacteria bacterium]